MEFKSHLEVVQLDQIDLDDRSLKISTGGVPAPLAASIDLAGIVTPPVLLPKKTSFMVVSGFKRIEAALRAGLKNTVARILNADTPYHQCISLAIIENSQARELNLVEQSRAILLLESIYKDYEQLGKAAQANGLQVNIGLTDKLRRIARMPSFLQHALTRDHVGLPVALQLNEFENEDTAKTIVHIFKELGLSLNRQKEFLEWIEAISRREGISIESLLAEGPFMEVIQNPETDRGMKSRLARNYLKKRRYPQISLTEERYKEAIKNLKLGKGVHLIAPPNFEGLTFSIKIDFQNYNELVSRYERLKNVIPTSIFKSLWDTIIS